MSSQNQLSRYGAISRSLELAPSAKVFLVGDSDDTSYGIQNLAADFHADKDGIARVYSTIQDAVNAASAGRGDVVLVAPGYDHTLGRADSWATAGVSVIGLGSGNGRPILRYTGIADEVGIGANNVTVKNIRFLAATDSVTRALDLDTGFSGHRIENCAFDFNATTNNFRVMIRAGSKRTDIVGNRFIAEDTAGANRAIAIEGGDADFLSIRDNFFYGQYDTVGDTTNGAAIIGMDTLNVTDTTLSGLEIRNNIFVSTDTAASAYVRMDAAPVHVRGILAGNRFVGYDSATADTDRLSLGTGVGKGLRSSGNHFVSDSGTEKLVGDTFVVL